MEQPHTASQSESQTPAPEHDYHSFLLRMWLVRDGVEVQWRATLEEVQSGEIQGFSNVREMLAYLAGLTEPHQVREVVVDPAPTEGRAGKTPG